MYHLTLYCLYLKCHSLFRNTDLPTKVPRTVNVMPIRGGDVTGRTVTVTETQAAGVRSARLNPAAARPGLTQ